MRTFWHAITRNEDGSHLLNVPYLAPAALLAALAALAWGVFF